jgi:hypothetical protein
MRLRIVLAAVIGAVLMTAAVAVASDQDHGRQRPPAALTDHYKALWMGEWAACRHHSLHGLAKELNLKVPAGRTPQVTARMIAKVAEGTLWNINKEFTTAVDGCRNGILWRFYHETNAARGA